MRFLAVLLLVVPSIWSERIQLIGITPEEAQNYIAQQSLDLKYAKKLNEAPLPVTRSDDGKGFLYKGRHIDNPDDYVEETYEASQFHGQDGLGRAMFGYTDHNQARLEARNANGEVRGSYQYVDPNGENIVVQYWSDSLGFHQTDNRPKIVLEPVTDTPENQAARLEHERLWNIAANLAKANPDPMSDVYNRAANAYDDKVQAEYDGSASESTHQGLTRYPAIKSNVVGAESQVSENKVKSGQYDPEDGVTSEPKGFFYSFEYPVDLLVESPSRRALKKSSEHEGGSKFRRSDETKVKDEKVGNVDDVSVSEEQKPKKEEPSVSLRAAEEGAIPVDAVHDAQVHPKQKNGLLNSQLLPVAV